MKFKKAQSEIITTVLIILLVLAAIIIVWQVVNSTVNKGAKQVESQSNCMGMNLQIASITDNTAKTPANTTITITRQTGSDTTTISDLTILVGGVVTTHTAVPISTYETKEYAFIGTYPKGSKVEIAPVLADGTKCPVAASATAP